jgi:hypothetical protein
MRKKISCHGGPAKKGADPARATATLLYAIRIIKPGRRALSIVQKPIFFRRLAAKGFSNSGCVLRA